MIAVNEVTKSFGTQLLFDNVSVKFTPGNRYGLTGPNLWGSVFWINGRNMKKIDDVTTHQIG